ncbi:Methyltransferase small [Candidatus Terasakiella magnetica]|uniref:Methyltransferase small n=1 Tax=Candidatus Terasakiella magnetica TaxID=1867952 RepID=A0A1C3RLJ0_9PROT|nr:SAM-dependent methyltransferase [Candidatus Terasakiella magnetica]SCA58127.1 Methyltransferase small [Candidatus Terasakiella magnetica]
MKTSNVINFPTKIETLTLGLPVVSTHGHKEGYIVDVRELKNKTCMLIGSGMKPEKHEYQVAWCDDKKQPHSLDWYLESLTLEFAENAVNQNLFMSLTELEIAFYQTGAAAATADRRRKQEHEQNLKAVERASFLLDAEDKFKEATKQLGQEPKSIIVAELIQNKSDLQSDYWGHSTLKTIILGFSKSKRQNFNEMRKMAINAKETKHLVEMGKDAEHRDAGHYCNGFYLKDGHEHASGWQIVKNELYSGVESIPSGEWCLSPFEISTKIEKEIAKQTENSTFEIEEHTHTKKGFQMFIAVPQFEAERETFVDWREKARALGGWYSKKWGKTPRGFAFKSIEAAKEFVSLFDQGTDPDGPNTPQPKKKNETVKKSPSNKFRELADNMQKQIDDKLCSNRLANTPKRQKEAGYARIDGNHLKRTQQALRILANLHDENKVPEELKNLKSKKAIHELTQSKLDTSNCGYYDTAIDTNKPYHDTAQSKILWSLLEGPSEEEQKAEALRRDIESLAFSKIPGYFPTPKSTIKNKMLPYAQIEKGMRCLEPQAGSGYIADELGEGVDCCEVNHSLREILKKKGHFLIGDDFLNLEPTPLYDRIVMNPPFENGQDIDHVQHAFQFLKPGGRLVAITSQGAFFHSTKKAKAFQEWINNVVEHMEDLPAREFKESGTNVSSKLIVLMK